MALFPATILHLDGGNDPLAPDVPTQDARGHWHLPMIVQGATAAFELTFQRPDQSYVNISAMTFAGQFRRRKNDTVIQASASFSQPDSQTLRVRLDFSDTAAMTSRSGYFDIEATYDDGEGGLDHVARPVKGTYRLDRESTK
jgi:hypothetical protein